MKLKNKIILFFILNLLAGEIKATHNRAGEITFVQTGALTIHAVITLYTKTSSVAADRDSIEIFWGDGTSEFLIRSNGWGYPQPNDVKISYYEGNHTFPARGTYTMSMTDPNRIAGILNVNFPDSENVPFYLETTFSFLNTQFQGENNSVVLLQPPIDIGCVGQIFKHNPNAYDIDGDSISYELIVPLQAKSTPVPAYKYPDAIGAGVKNHFSFNEITGDLIWDSPQIAGDYNVAFKVNEYRNGKLITSTIRDMQIFITANCNSIPPDLVIPGDKCMIAGDTLNIKVTANDSDPGQKILINGSGEPFVSKYGKAVLENNNIFQNSPVTSTFIWETACEHVAKPYYQIVFKAMDNSLSDTSGLVDLKIFKVKISGPAPQNPETIFSDSKIKLTWTFPYPCINSDNGYFRGFSIWRRNSSNNFPLDTCTPGLTNKGYKIIEHLTNKNDGINYYYIDDDIEPGKIYCYRILAEYAHKTDNGFPYNPVQSLASDETCEFVPDDRPLVTKVDVISTDMSEGKILINWIKPNITAFDTISYPPPYKYRLLRSVDNSNNFEYIDDAEMEFSSYFAQDTMRYEDANLNTSSIQYFYKIEMYSDNNLHSTSKKASSIHLITKPLDNKIKLETNLDIPWTNSKYTFYRSNNFTGPFEQIGTNQIPEYFDKHLINGEKYCYYVQSYGYYGSNSFKIINKSQISCSSPKDNEKPCNPELTIDNNCDEIENNEQYINFLKWTNPNIFCQNTNDVAGYKIYYSNGIDSSFYLLFNINNAERTDTTHKPGNYAGCYYVTAMDASGNESDPSRIICAKSCPLYILPNTFTPNKDGQNDLLVPIAKRHIDKIDLKIFNQWGIMVFHTKNPEILWDGTTNSGKKLNRGTYYYICTPYSLNSSLPTLKGYIEIIY